MKGDRRLGSDKSRVRRGFAAAAVSAAVALAVSLPMAFEVAEAETEEPASTTQLSVIASDETDAPDESEDNTDDTAPVSILDGTAEREDPATPGG